MSFADEYKVWTWKSIYGLHWIINPGLTINELFLGQRMPKVMLIQKGSTKTLPEKSFVFCPHCGIIHPSLEWIWFKKIFFRKWLRIQKEKFSKPLKLSAPEYSVWLYGLNIGIGYYLLVMVTKFVIIQKTFTWKKPIGNFIGAMIVGFVSSAIIKEMIMKRPVKKNLSLKEN